MVHCCCARQRMAGCFSGSALMNGTNSEVKRFFFFPSCHNFTYALYFETTRQCTSPIVQDRAPSAFTSYATQTAAHDQNVCGRAWIRLCRSSGHWMAHWAQRETLTTMGVVGALADEAIGALGAMGADGAVGEISCIGGSTATTTFIPTKTEPLAKSRVAKKCRRRQHADE
jgi:hypothetical protein